jgi:hypothetical protein
MNFRELSYALSELSEVPSVRHYEGAVDTSQPTGVIKK